MDSFLSLLSAEIPRLRRYARSLAHDPDLSDDLVQDCLERAIKRRELFKDGTNLRAWLFRILYNLFITEVRKKQRRRETHLGERAANGIAPPNQENVMHIHDITRRYMELAEGQREVLYLVSVEGMSYEEVATVLKIPVGTVRSRLSRARESIRIAATAARAL